MAEKWSYTELLDTLLTDEVERREFRQLARRLTKSGLAPTLSSMAAFPSILLRLEHTAPPGRGFRNAAGLSRSPRQPTLDGRQRCGLPSE